MDISVKIRSEKERLEMLYIYYLSNIQNQVLQKKGFIISPKPTLTDLSMKLNNLYEVVLPTTDIEINERNFLKHSDSNISSPLTYDIEIYKKSPAILNDPFSTFHYDATKLIDYIDNNKVVLSEFFSFFYEVKEAYTKVEINIIPTPFGANSFFFKKDKDVLELWLSYRTDFPIESTIFPICAATVLSLLWKKDEQNPEYWKARQFLVDFLRKFSVLAPLSKHIRYTDIVEPSEQELILQAQKASNIYLQKLGFAVAKKDGLEIKGNILTVFESEIYLTSTEVQVMQKLMKESPNIVTFDTLGDIVWHENLDKFSLEALYKTISRIREKIRDTGYISDFIFTVKNKGVMLYF